MPKKPLLTIIISAASIWFIGCIGGLCQAPVIDNLTMGFSPNAGHNYLQDIIDQVNPANGSLNIQILAPAPHERGINFPIMVFSYQSNGLYEWAPYVTYDSESLGGYNSPPTIIERFNIYYSPSATISQTAFGSPLTSPYALAKLSASNNQLLDNIDNFPIVCTFWNNYIYTDNLNRAHALGLYFQTPGPDNAVSCAHFRQYDTALHTGGDEEITGIINPDAPNIPYIFDLHGNVISSGHNSPIEDTNGNHLNGTGRTYQFNGNSLTIPGLAQPYTYSFANAGGAPTQPYNPNSILVTNVATNGSCPSGLPLPNGTQVNGNLTIKQPNGTSYTITYDPNYNLVSRIQYSTGYTITYTWGNNPQSDSEVYTDNSSNPQFICGYTFDMPAIMKRTVSLDGINNILEQDFTYSASHGNTSPGWKKTTVRTYDLVRNTPPEIVVYHYVPFIPPALPGSNRYSYSSIPQEDLIEYQDSTGRILQTVKKTWSAWNLLSGECVILPNGQVSGKFYQYQNYPTNLQGYNHASTDLISDLSEYDFGAVSSTCVQPSTVPARETKTTFQTFPQTPMHTYILDRPQEIDVLDHGTLLSETLYSYDEFPTLSTGGAIGHDDLNYGSASTAPRGNVTTITTKCLQSCLDSVLHYHYDDTGSIVESDDAKGVPTKFSYADSYTSDGGSPNGITNTYVTQITPSPVNSVSHARTMQYDFNKGLIKTFKDENSASSFFTYSDPMMRMTESDYPDGGSVSMAYNDVTSNPSTQTTQHINSRESKVSLTLFDAAGGISQNELVSDPQGPIFSDHTNDGHGRPYKISNPYRSKSDPTYGQVVFTYDALGREVLRQNPDHTFIQHCYDGIGLNGQTNCSSNRSSLSGVTWVDVTDENNNDRQESRDAFGRLVAVVEPPTSVGGHGAESDYTYDALGNLLSVTQQGVSGEPQRTRTFSYNSLSRLLTATGPETGTICYGTWSQGQAGTGTCQNGYDANGNLQYKTDARNFTTTYSYDALNRLIQATAPLVNSSGAISGQYQSTCYQYDSVPGAATGGNLVGRLTAEWMQSGNTCASSYDPSVGALTAKVILSYDALGRPLLSQQCIKQMCQATPFTQNQTYDLAGNLSTWTEGRGVMTFSQYFDSAGRSASVVNQGFGSSPSTLFSTQSFTPGGALQNWNIGNYLNYSRTYDNRLRVTGQTVLH